MLKRVIKLEQHKLHFEGKTEYVKTGNYRTKKVKYVNAG